MFRNRPGCRNSSLAHPLCSEAKTSGAEEQAGCWELPQTPRHGAALSRQEEFWASGRGGLGVAEASRSWDVCGSRDRARAKPGVPSSNGSHGMPLP